MRKFIVIRQEGKYKKIFIDDILFCKAVGAYTNFHLTDNKTILTSMLLKDVENKLNSYNFSRINRSYLVNLDHCFELLTGNKPEIVLSNNIKLEISQSRLKYLREQFCVY